MIAPLLLIACAPVATAVQLSDPSRSIDRPAYDFDIPRATRVMALHELSRQAGGLLLGYLSTNTAEEEALVGPIRGQLKVEDVLAVVLRSSSLTYRWVENTMVSVEPMPPGENNETLIAPAPPDLRANDPTWSRLPEEIIVESSSLKDLTNSATAAEVITRKQLRSLGVQSLSEALGYLSQNTFLRQADSLSRTAQATQFRGLGAPLVLINGRRAFPSSSSTQLSAFDLAMIPLNAVQRIEVIFDSSGLSYGSDAIGGVVNIILRSEDIPPSLELRYGAAADGAQEKRMTAGLGMQREVIGASIVIDYLNQGDLLGVERSIWRDQNYASRGGEDRRSLVSNPASINAATAEVPAGLSSSEPTSLFRYTSIVPRENRFSAIGQANALLGPHVHLSSQLVFSRRRSTFEFAPPTINSRLVPETNAHSDFNLPVVADRLFTEADSQAEIASSELRRGSIAVSGPLRSWNWEVSALISRDSAAFALTNLLDESRLRSALESNDTSRALNIFDTGSVGDTALLNSLLRGEKYGLTFSGAQVAFQLEGPVTRLSSGAISMLLGGEWRNESVAFDNETSGSAPAKRSIAAAYLQGRIPLIAAHMHVPAIHALFATFGTRFDAFESEHAVRSHVGLTWSISSSLTIRASKGQTINPPSLIELHAPALGNIARVSDPARDGEVTTVYASTSGNQNLNSSGGDITTVGISFTPDSAMNLQISADYWRTSADHLAFSVPLRWTLVHQDLFPGSITRAEPQQIDALLGRPGPLQSIQSPRLNAGETRLSGVDLGLRADVQTDSGRWTPELVATWFNRFDATYPGIHNRDWVGIASELGSIPSWRAVLSLRWRRGAFGISTSMRHTPAYEDAAAGVLTGRSISSRTVCDLQASVALGAKEQASMWSDLELSAGIIDLFNEKSSVSEVGDVAGVDISQTDLRRRSWYLRAERKF